MKRSLLGMAGLWVAVLVSGCAPEEGLDDDLVDEENLASNEDALELPNTEGATAPGRIEATSNPSAMCGNTTLIRNSTVRSGSGSWISYGVLPGGSSVAHTSCGVFRYYLGNTYIQILNKNPNYPGIAYGWVLNNNVY